MICPRCGKIYYENELYCVDCGVLLEENIKTKEELEEKIKTEKKPKKKSKLFIIILLFILIIISVFIVLFFIKKDNEYSGSSSKNEISYAYGDNNNLKFIDGTFSLKKINGVDDVLEALKDIKDELNIKDINNELKEESVETSEGVTYYKFNQVYKDVLVYGQNIIVSVDKTGKILSFSGYYIPNIETDVNPKKSEDEAKRIVSTDLGSNSKILKSELSILADFNKQKLVYIISGYSENSFLEYIVDANTGDIIDKYEMLESVENYSYTGLGLDNQEYTINLEKHYDITLGQRYRFYDASRKIGVSDCRSVGQNMALLMELIPGAFTPISVAINDGKIDLTYQNEDFIKAAVLTMHNYETIYDYYKNILGRDSYDNKGSKIKVNLGVTARTFSNKDLNNAAWNPLVDEMFIGSYKGKSFSLAFDVLTHEFTHGVIEHTANFAHSAKEEDKPFETGSLNEAYSDVLGHLIEGKNWTMGESIEVMRDATNPEKYESPSVKGGKYYYPDGFLSEERTLEQFLKENNLERVIDYDKGGVHRNSNVPTHAAYLMYESGAFKSREEMAKVWYNSLFMLSSYSNFEDAALAIIKSAKNLGLSDDAIYKITESFIDTNILEQKDVTISGKVSSDKSNLIGASLDVLSYEDGRHIKSCRTSKNGEYSLSLPVGMYKIKFSKKGFADYTIVVNVKGNTKLDIKMSKKSKNNNKSLVNSCKSSNCVNVTIYFLDNDNSNKLNEDYEVYSIDKGSKIDVKQIVNYANKVLKSNMLSTDGKSFYVTVSGLKMEFGWYYKGTDNKFDFNLPINEDVSIEMKLFDGLIDDELINDFSSLFYN